MSQKVVHFDTTRCFQIHGQLAPDWGGDEALGGSLADTALMLAHILRRGGLRGHN